MQFVIIRKFESIKAFEGDKTVVGKAKELESEFIVQCCFHEAEIGEISPMRPSRLKKVTTLHAAENSI